MKKSDYRLIAYVGVILGAIFLFAGVYASLYNEMAFELGSIFPYVRYTPGSLMCGIVSLIISALMWRESQPTPIPFNMIMKRLIAYVGVALGAVLLAFGLYVGTPLIIAGAILLTAGLLMLKAPKELPIPA
jgi:protein-S-isoprenylcysteine O-methyltransferase Ste14